MSHVIDNIMELKKTCLNIMSFANYDLEAQGGSSTQPLKSANSKNSEHFHNSIDEVFEKVAKQVQIFHDNITEIESLKKRIGSRRDCIDLRNSIDDLIYTITQLKDAIRPLIDNLEVVVEKMRSSTNIDKVDSNLDKSRKYFIMRDRLRNEYNQQCNQLTTLIKSYKDKSRQYVLPANEVHERTSLLHNEDSSQEQNQILETEQIDESQLQYHIQITEQREQEISKINRGIHEINSIFRDLGEIVQHQGEQLDTVENNMSRFSSNAQDAHKELTRAHEYQKKKGKWSCVFLVALVIFVLIVVLAVLA